MERTLIKLLRQVEMRVRVAEFVSTVRNFAEHVEDCSPCSKLIRDRRTNRCRGSSFKAWVFYDKCGVQMSDLVRGFHRHDWQLSFRRRTHLNVTSFLLTCQGFTLTGLLILMPFVLQYSNLGVFLISSTSRLQVVSEKHAEIVRSNETSMIVV